MSLGDSHKGFRVLGTNSDYFKHYRYGDQQPLSLVKGRPFDGVMEVVLGSEVAKKLAYQIGDSLFLSHGIVSASFNKHKDHPFTVVGVLAPTGTPVDHTVHVGLEGLEAIHIGWNNGFRVPGSTTASESLDKSQLQPKNITAFMLGLKSKIVTFKVQRQLNNYKKEPLLAILPGVVLSEIWQMMRVFENTLRLVSALVFFSAALGVSALLLSSVRERRQEIQLLRVIGAPPIFLFLLIEIEALVITLLSLILGSSVLMVCLLILKPLLATQLGLTIDANIFNQDIIICAGILLAVSAFAAMLPAFNVYRKALKVSV
jgi:putative ABC transport system permease protein